MPVEISIKGLSLDQFAGLADFLTSGRNPELAADGSVFTDMERNVLKRFCILRSAGANEDKDKMDVLLQIGENISTRGTNKPTPRKYVDDLYRSMSVFDHNEDQEPARAYSETTHRG